MCGKVVLQRCGSDFVHEMRTTHVTTAKIECNTSVENGIASVVDTFECDK